MAKTLGLLAKAKSTEIKKPGIKTWASSLAADQRVELDETIDWMRSGTPGIDRPTWGQLRELIADNLGKTVSEPTLRRYAQNKR